MSLYSKHILPRIVDCACGGRAFEEQMLRIVPQAQGIVLDLGIGTGLNLPLYDKCKVTKIIGLDPCQNSLDIAKKVAGGLDIPVDCLQAYGEEIPLEDRSVDTVVLTYTLCTVRDVDAVLREIRRVLRPEGEVLFCEHVRAPTPWNSVLQSLAKRPWSFLLGGCQLDRQATPAFRQAKFHVNAKTAKLQGMPLPIAWQTIGSARPSGKNYIPEWRVTAPHINLSFQ